MTRALLLIATLSFTSASLPASASSLENLFQNQKRVEISPVIYEGLPFHSSDAHKVCGVLGYTRVVDKALESCTNGEDIWSFRSSASEAAELVSSKCSSFGYKLSSLTCAGN
ncbi:MAG: hypothetical protein AAF202_04340 [Pseudomonadota bacterium]